MEEREEEWGGGGGKGETQAGGKIKREWRGRLKS